MSDSILLPDDAPQSVNDMVMTRNIGETLDRHYPGYPWLVRVEGWRGLASISLIDVNIRRPYWLKLSTINSDKHYRCVVRAGGHLLEAYRLSRSKAEQDKLENLPRSFDGEALIDPESMRPAARKSYLRERIRNEWTRVKRWFQASKRPLTS